MTKVDIISGFLGAGKTTLIRKLIAEVFAGQQIVLIENEFGEIGIDGGFLKDAGINITEMNSGCICCSLVGDFGEALHQVVEQFHPDRILIEPSGVGKLSDVRRAVEDAAADCGLVVNSLVTVADVSKVKIYMKNFGEFYNNQIESAGCIVLSRTQSVSQEKLDAAAALIREKNPNAALVTTPWDDLTGAQILGAMEQSVSLAEELLAEAEEDVCPVCGHHHDHGEHDHHHHDHDEHEHHHDHDHDEHGHEHDHDEHEHHHDHDHDEHEHDHDHDHGEHEHEHDHDEHEHHHDHDEHDHDHDEHGYHHHHHDHEGHGHHHHHADEVFTSWGKETTKKYTKEEVETILEKLENAEVYGIVLRAKGMLPSPDGTWIYFDMVPGERELREGQPEYTGRLCVIGSKLAEEALSGLFGL